MRPTSCSQGHKHIRLKSPAVQLPSLPAAHMYVGRTNLTLAEVRTFNSLQQNLAYELHCNDCRHVAGSLTWPNVPRYHASALVPACNPISFTHWDSDSAGGAGRHYVNSIIHYTTGVQGAASALTRHSFRATRATLGSHWADCTILAGHLLTDVSNWPRIKAASQVQAIFGTLMTVTRLHTSFLYIALPEGYCIRDITMKTLRLAVDRNTAALSLIRS